MSNGEKFRPTSGKVAAIVAYLLIFGLIVESAISSSSTAIGITAIVGVSVGYGLYLILHKPHLIIGDDGIVIVNPISRHEFIWSEVEEIDTKYTMSVVVNGQRIHAWAAPASGRYHARKIHPSEVRGTAFDGFEAIAASDSPRSDSGVAAHIARLKWEQSKRH